MARGRFRALRLRTKSPPRQIVLLLQISPRPRRRRSRGRVRAWDGVAAGEEEGARAGTGAQWPSRPWWRSASSCPLPSSSPPCRRSRRTAASAPPLRLVQDLYRIFDQVNNEEFPSGKKLPESSKVIDDEG